MDDQQGSQELNDRARDVLKSLIREYVRTGRPVGSGRLSKRNREGLSPATLRKVMADLVRMGLAAQPHTSAGRVPTTRGYRFYVDSLLETRHLPSTAEDMIRTSLESESDPEELMNKTSQILSSLSNNIGFVLAPPVSAAAMTHIKFVATSRQRVLVILVTGSAMVQHRMIRVDQTISQSDLDQAGRYLVTHFRGLTLAEIRKQLLRLLTEEKSLYDRLLKNVVMLGAASLVKCEGEEDEESQVYLGGTSCVVQKSASADVDRIAVLLETLEEKRRLVKIVTECLNTDSPGPTVRIGLEEEIPGMGDWALVSSPYVYNQRAIGGLGILGPSRMEYENAISLVHYVARLFTTLFQSN